ncbi:DNA-deoxyinosine glycosylase [Butyricicoccus porcorum]|uniref:DNA-deoxyinosine glycosylase n=1 Tax=Butyricicoccus porcorum TaxID=1945634 RepID=A0A252F2T2_9FIRM|nr:DNA-deoxyinosine glycosylase [Butyricicoccus porcorum]MCI6925883.1 DNA-deoxyinosine glycosylase [Butyricicoccus porcorum]MDD6986107.1 DNA-deoxyinosine glycosylase [Butyricicoccus porcorum]MDY4484341.1 DNA-deoxyinosine glycosylase [Butyricicoccus porcorum]OUM20042.1 DNA-deoxyinosine glycosylase [Butyricicoccus porcorum]
MLVTHEFGPWYDTQSRVLVLGTMPSPKSREAGFYYAHPQNRFWRVLPALYGEPPLIGNITAQQDFLTRRHIALWDVLASCEIEGASDSSIRNPVPNDMNVILRAAPIRAIFATGQKAGALYKKYCLPQCGVPVQVLPSTSPANCAVKLDALCEKYAVIRQAAEA